MNLTAIEEFPLRTGLTQFNHASYGLSSLRTIAEGERLRRRIESDPTRHLGAELTEQLTAQTELVAQVLDLEPARLTLCANATSAAAAITASVPLSPDSTVVVLDVEYASIRRAWEVACAKAGARLTTATILTPVESAADVVAALDRQIAGPVDYLQVSVITSSTAIHLPIPALSEWAVQRGGQLVLDAAHAPGHLPLPADMWGAMAAFGTLHKWFPTLRPVGFLWLDSDFDVRPAEVSLTWDSPDLGERFAWPGTFDPIPRLSVDTALGQWLEWHADGRLAASETLTDTIDRAMVGISARPTAAPQFRPPRMRSFVLDRITAPQLKEALQKADIRAWVGHGTAGECLLRLATHIYNDENDIDRVTSRIQEVLSR
ncbi:aminotransferase class V-fold PLP-dependent enzyme [Nocardia jiangsuensis]|uniref:Aminotransferase class V-fold PLP-dependent enzyme n=1 Tax=Nocardia jiangsuensis TaxID=1691563 RepID=A0ABV8DLZ1_9NOCA